jgi:hypothetical protein
MNPFIGVGVAFVILGSFVAVRSRSLLEWRAKLVNALPSWLPRRLIVMGVDPSNIPESLVWFQRIAAFSAIAMGLFVIFLGTMAQKTPSGWVVNLRQH